MVNLSWVWDAFSALWHESGLHLSHLPDGGLVIALDILTLQPGWYFSPFCLWQQNIHKIYYLGTNVMEVTNFFLLEFKAHSIRGDSCLVLSSWSKIHGWGAHRPQVEPTNIVMLSGHNVKLFLNSYPPTHRLVQFWAIIREVALYRRWWFTQSLAANQST